MITQDQIKSTTIEEIQWNPSKDGILIPRIRIKPITISGNKITYVTGFNARFIEDNSLSTGAVVNIIRSGDVIPVIHNVIETVNKAELPDTNLQRDTTKTHIRLKNINENSSSNV